jgi:hypothetical protein
LWGRKLCELYGGTREEYRQRQIWSTYFERDYIQGLATDKIPKGRLMSDAFTMAFARALGRAAASNLIVGRCGPGREVFFDDGDELLIEDAHGIPTEIVVADHTGTFSDCDNNLAHMIPAYAACVEKRAGFLPSVRAFAEVFVRAFEERFRQIQTDYRKRRHAFDTLFKYKYRQSESEHRACFYDQWACTVARLHTTDADRMFREFRSHLHLS